MEFKLELDKFMQRLDSDRQIEVCVGVAQPTLPNASVSFHIPEIVLTGASEFFVKALDSETFLEGHRNRLEFPEDDVQAWRVLVFWLLQKRLPTDVTSKGLLTSTDRESLLVRCWVVGDKYALRDYQDEIMMELLDYHRCYCTTLDIVKNAFEGTPVGSCLRKRMAEAVVLLLDEESIEYQDLDELDGVVGFASELIKAHRENADGREARAELAGNFLNNDIDGCPRWRQFMVGQGPKRHWIFDPHRRSLP